MSEVVERIAREICCPDGKCHAEVRNAEEGSRFITKHVCAARFDMKTARAVLRTIRIPTPEMLEAANAVGSDLSPALPHEIWPAMIDAAIGKTS